MDIDAIKRQLLELREELMASDDREGRATVTLDQTRVGRLSRIDALQSQAISEETERRRQFQLRRIEIALRDIANADYGYCELCGEVIAEARLLADPTAKHCIACARAAESK